MRSFLPSLLVALLVFVPTAFAEEGAEEFPVYDASDLAIEEESLPEGMKLLDETPDTTPGYALEGWVEQVAEGLGLDTGDLLLETRVLANAEGIAATVLVVSLDAEPKGLREALEKAAGPSGHAVRELGHPTRLVVVAAPAEMQAGLLALQRTTAVKTLTRLAHERLEAGSRVGAVGYAEGAMQVDATAALPHAVLAMAALGDGKKEEALSHFKRAFAKDAILPPTGRLALTGLGEYALMLLGEKTAPANHEARALLERAVALEDQAGPKDAPHVNRYNLACALSLLGEKDAALKHLARSFEMAKDRMPADGYRMFVVHATRDEDLAPLREDARYKEILEKAMGGRGHSSGGI